MPSGSTLDWIALALLPGVGPVLAHRALERFGDPAEIAFRIDPRELLAFRGCRRDVPERVAGARRDLERRAARELRRTRRHGARVLTPADSDYPPLLAALDDPPVALWIEGRLPPTAVRVAVIGSRTPTRYGRELAVGLGGGLAARGVEVVSGGARGIDTLAHRGALEVGQPTVAVLGSGLLELYPVENKRLFREIAASGALVTEFPMAEPPRAGHFLRRNRLISGLSAAVVVVEAARRSGARSTAGHALDQGREVLAVPGPVTSVKSEGCHALIQEGAKLVRNLDDILVELPPPYRARLPADRDLSASGEALKGLPELTPDERRVLEMLDPSTPVQLDELADRALFGIARLQSALFGLELMGAVEQRPGRYYLLRPRRKG